jgi:hypothetical protein
MHEILQSGQSNPIEYENSFSPFSAKINDQNVKYHRSPFSHYLKFYAFPSLNIQPYLSL